MRPAGFGSRPVVSLEPGVPVHERRKPNSCVHSQRQCGSSWDGQPAPGRLLSQRRVNFPSSGHASPPGVAAGDVASPKLASPAGAQITDAECSRQR